MITNYSSLAALLLSIACLLVYVFFLTPKQFGEVLRPRDWLTRLRWIILTLLVLSIATAIPSTVYQYYRTIGQEYKVLRNITTVTTQVSKLSTTVLLVLVYTYKRKE